VKIVAACIQRQCDGIVNVCSTFVADGGAGNRKK